jgi:DNA-binding IclR family transcriptional regulator
VLIGIPAADGVQVIHHVFCPDGTPQRLRVGEVRPVHASALGKVLLAHTPWLRSRLRASALERYTSRTTTDRELLLTQVRKIKTLGYGIEVGEYVSETGGVAAPIRRYGGLGVGAIAVFGPTDRIFSTQGRPHREITRRVMAAAKAISEQLAELG